MLFNLIKFVHSLFKEYGVSPTGAISKFMVRMDEYKLEEGNYYSSISEQHTSLVNWSNAYSDPDMRDVAIQHGLEALRGAFYTLMKIYYVDIYVSLRSKLYLNINDSELEIISHSVKDSRDALSVALGNAVYAERLNVVLNATLLGYIDLPTAEEVLNRMNEVISQSDQVIEQNVNQIVTLRDALIELIELTEELPSLDVNIFDASYDFELVENSSNVIDLTGETISDKVVEFVSNYKESIDKTKSVFDSYELDTNNWGSEEPTNENNIFGTNPGIKACIEDNQVDKLFLYVSKINKIDELIGLYKQTIDFNVNALKENTKFLDILTEKATPSL